MTNIIIYEKFWQKVEEKMAYSIIGAGEKK